MAAVRRFSSDSGFAGPFGCDGTVKGDFRHGGIGCGPDHRLVGGVVGGDRDGEGLGAAHGQGEGSPVQGHAGGGNYFGGDELLPLGKGLCVASGDAVNRGGGRIGEGVAPDTGNTLGDGEGLELGVLIEGDCRP